MGTQGNLGSIAIACRREHCSQQPLGSGAARLSGKCAPSGAMCRQCSPGMCTGHLWCRSDGWCARKCAMSSAGAAPRHPSSDFPVSQPPEANDQMSSDLHSHSSRSSWHPSPILLAIVCARTGRSTKLRIDVWKRSIICHMELSPSECASWALSHLFVTGNIVPGTGCKHIQCCPPPKMARSISKLAYALRVVEHLFFARPW